MPNFVPILALVGIPLGSLSGAPASPAVQEAPEPFTEAFALALDRAALLAGSQLVPGTPDAYFYTALHHQQRGDLDAAERLLDEWAARHPGAADAPRQRQLRARQALLRFDTDPAATEAFLRAQYALDLDAAAPEPEAILRLPTRVQPAWIADEAFLRSAFEAQGGVVRQLTDAGLHLVAARDLDKDQRAALLHRRLTPGFPGLVGSVLRDLADGARFGERAVHARLLLEQLDECLSQRPELADDTAFVQAYVQRLAPGADEDPKARGTRTAHLARLTRFVDRLPGSADALRALVLHHRLQLDLEDGRVDRDLLRAYLRLPWTSDLTEPKRERTFALKDDYRTGLRTATSGDALVREALQALFARAEGPEASGFMHWVGPLRREVVEQLFHEARLVTQDDPEAIARAAAALEPAALEALRARVDLEFPRTQRSEFRRGEPVELTVLTKNVDELLVRLYELDTLGHFSAARDAGEALRDLTEDLPLDGLVAHSEKVRRIEASPLRRTHNTFRFDGLEAPGVYLVEFVGGGRACRALVRLGGLVATARIGAAGHVLRIYDETGAPAPDSAVWVDGREFAADAQGDVRVPFTSSPGPRTVVLRSGAFGALYEAQLVDEVYELEVRAHVPREQLRAGERATLTVRPRLTTAGHPASLALLEVPTLRLTLGGQGGAQSVEEVRKVTLRDDGALVHEFTVPEGLHTVHVALSAEVDRVSRDGRVRVSGAAPVVRVDGQVDSAVVEAPLLLPTPEGYVLQVVGRNGEPLGRAELHVAFRPQRFQRERRLRLATDEAGRVQLGQLAGIAALTVTLRGCEPFEYTLAPHGPWAPPARIHAQAGAEVTLALPLALDEADARAELYERRGDAWARASSAALVRDGGLLRIQGLVAGDHDLVFPHLGHEVRIVVTDGVRLDRSALANSGVRLVELSSARPLAIAAATLDAEGLTVRLHHADPSTRVHIHVSRFEPSQPAANALMYAAGRGSALAAWRWASSELGRSKALSDEHRYVLERRRAPRFPGNMLARPGLLLNPWVVEPDLAHTLGLGGGAGSAFGGRAGGEKSSKAAGHGGPSDAPGARDNRFVDLGWLAGATPALIDLVPDADGVVRVPGTALGSGQLIEVVAVRGAETAAARVVRAEAPLARRDRRHLAGLAPTEHFVRERRIVHLERGERLALAEGGINQVRTVASLPDAFELLARSCTSHELGQFRFLAQWGSLAPGEKLAKYAEFACHEVDLFLQRKDPEFFAAVVRPFLANKLHKGFMDAYLVGDDLGRFGEPWAFQRLNALERALYLRAAGEDAARHLRTSPWMRSFGGAALDQALRRVLAEGALVDDAPVWRGGGAWSDADGAPGSVEGDPYAGEEESIEEEELEDDDQPAEDAPFEDRAFNDRLSDAEALRRDVAARKGAQRFAEALGATQEWAERGYWGIQPAAGGAAVLQASPFWVDFAASPAAGPFRSVHFPLAQRSLNEVLLALAVLDLPFASDAPPIARDGATLVAERACYVIVDEVRRAPLQRDAALLVGESERAVFGERQPVTADKPYVRGVAYRRQVVVTNASDVPREVDVLSEVPVGALPLKRSLARSATHAALGPFESAALEVWFYFPAAGAFPALPAQVMSRGAPRAVAALRPCVVLEPDLTEDPAAWATVAARGSVQEVLQRLNADDFDPERSPLALLAWRMNERSSFDAVTAALRARRIHSDALWQYSVLHRDPRTLREWLAMQSSLRETYGEHFECALLTLAPTERGWYTHLEYSPLVHARAHMFGGRRALTNGALAQQYERFLSQLVWAAAPTAEDRLEAAYHLFLQDRTPEALAQFDAVDRTEVATALQYDYTAVYAALYRADLQRARALAEPHAAHPVAHWRARFTAALALLDEVEGRGQARPETEADVAGRERSLELAVVGDAVQITAAGLAEVELSYRPMDLELVFSRTPFLEVASDAFRSVRPAQTERVALNRDGTASRALPPELRGRDVFVEVRGGGFVRSVTHVSSGLRVRSFEALGQLEVRDAATGAPVSAAYVKVYKRTAGGKVSFHKDGYTDLRGRFDYVAVSGASDRGVERFALFVQHAALGAETLQVAPPPR